MNWENGDVSYTYLDYDGSEECQKALQSKDLFIEKDAVRGNILKEAYGLCSCEEIGEISEGCRIVIVFGKVLIVRAEKKEVRVRVTINDTASLYQLSSAIGFLKDVSGLDIWKYSRDLGKLLVFDLCVPDDISRRIGNYAKDKGWFDVSYPPQ